MSERAHVLVNVLLTQDVDGAKVITNDFMKEEHHHVFLRAYDALYL